MIIGNKTLKELFPKYFKDIAENGIDLRLGKLEGMVQDDTVIGCIGDVKHPPKYYEMKTVIKDGQECYELLPHNFYFATIDREIEIPNGHCQIYYLRSTFSRCGLILLSSVGDDGFKGYLRMGLYNCSPKSIFIGKNERIIQALTIRNDGTATSYDGSYQNDKIYKKIGENE